MSHQYHRLGSSDGRRSRACSFALPLRLAYVLAIFLPLAFIVACVLRYDIKSEAFAPTNHGGKRLRTVVAVFRHGDRTAWKHFTWERYAFEWRMGALTREGMLGAFALGQKLRRDYGELLVDDAAVAFDSGDVPTLAAPLQQRHTRPRYVYARSTDTDPTVDTANSLLIGLFSRLDTHAEKAICTCRNFAGTRSAPECLADCMRVQYVPKIPKVHVPHSDDPDLALHQDMLCEGWKQHVHDLQNSDEWKDKSEQDYAEAIALMRELNGGNDTAYFDDPFDAAVPVRNASVDLALTYHVWSNVNCYEQHGIRYSDAHSNAELLDKLGNATDWVWHARYDPAYGNMTGGILLNEILDRITASINYQKAESMRKQSARADLWRRFLTRDDTEDEERSLGVHAWHRMYLYSAHDFTLFSLLSALDARRDGSWDDIEMPPYASAIVFEVWEVDDDADWHSPQSVRSARRAPESDDHAAEHTDEVNAEQREAVVNANGEIVFKHRGGPSGQPSQRKLEGQPPQTLHDVSQRGRNHRRRREPQYKLVVKYLDDEIEVVGCEEQPCDFDAFVRAVHDTQRGVDYDECVRRDA